MKKNITRVQIKPKPCLPRAIWDSMSRKGSAHTPEACPRTNAALFKETADWKLKWSSWVETVLPEYKSLKKRVDKGNVLDAYSKY